ncbi:L,D-transpeptidase [Pseudonocardia sp. TRM90224]|uniref:L,D-transpeptidase n=1 Tax=Pseudonocardia sp. TRM90224 TaxID=2812678 RepID=UPI001E2EE308|nr:L,D-transpeptidase [Pseudonocardia sp. TRM90224]
MGRNQVRKIGIALLMAAAVVSVQACGSASTTPASTPSAASAALPAAAPAPEDEAEVTPTPEPTAAPTPTVAKKSPQLVAASQPLADGTPCTVAAKACVDLDSQRAWLLDGKGEVVRGPVDVASGSKAEPTPPGWDLRVYLKDQDHVSNESFTDGVPDPMPYSVFFDAGGIAFHEGSPEGASAGCIHLGDEDAKAWFAFLQMGDQVQVVNASKVMPERGLTYDGPVYGYGGARAAGEGEKKHDRDGEHDNNRDARSAEGGSNDD